MTARIGPVEVWEQFGHDNELRMTLSSEENDVYLSRVAVVRLRDHLSAVLGDQPAAPTMTRAAALKTAEETVSRMAPATIGRGYTDGTAPLQARMDAVLRIAAFLASGGAE